MKKSIIAFALSVLLVTLLVAEERLFVYRTDKNVASYSVSSIDSIKFAEDQTAVNIFTDKTTVAYPINEIDSIIFCGSPDTVKVTYNGTTVDIQNPLYGAGVNITVNGADVIVNSTLTDNQVKYLLKGNSSDGMFKIYSTYKFELILGGLTLTNNDGPAINIQSKKRIDLKLEPGTINTLTDGSGYASSTEDQKGTIFSEGQLIFGGSGSLTVKGNKGHAICSDDYIEIENGNITVTGAVKDGIHAKDHFNLEGGTLNITATGDAVECETGKIKVEGGALTSTTASADAKGLKCDSTFTMTGGNLNLTVTGNQGKGIKSIGKMSISGGSITINTSGGAVLTASGSGYDPSYCTAIKCDSTINISGSSITITATGTAGKGISSDNDINITGGTIKVTTSGNGASYTNYAGVIDSYSGSAIEADGNINIQAGEINITSSGSGVRGISADGTTTFGYLTNIPVINISNTGTKLLVSGTANYSTAVYAEPKNIKSDGSITINNGTFTLSCTQQGSELIDSDTDLNIFGGIFTMTLGGNQSKGFNATGAINLNGGTIGFTASGGVVLENVAAATYNPSYCTAIKSTGSTNINGSDITITHTGIAGKGISSDADINIISGILKITTSGSGATYKNALNVTDSYNAVCITADGSLTIKEGSITCSSAGSGGKGISANGTITIGDIASKPEINITTAGAKFLVTGSDYCHPKALKADGAITINNCNSSINSTDDGIHSETSITINDGNINITNSLEGIESKYIYLKGGTTNVTATNDGLNATMGLVAGGTESNDNSLLSISGGTHYVNATNGDAIDSNGNILITGGVTFANGPNSGVEEAVDFNGNFNMNGGTFIGAGSSSNMTKAMSSTSTQPNMYLSTSSMVSSATMLTITIGGVATACFKPRNGGYKFLISTPQMTKGAAYVIYTGGTYTGGTSTNNLYQNGTFSNTGATTKKSGNLSTSATVNTITF